MLSRNDDLQYFKNKHNKSSNVENKNNELSRLKKQTNKLHCYENQADELYYLKRRNNELPQIKNLDNELLCFENSDNKLRCAGSRACRVFATIAVFVVSLLLIMPSYDNAIVPFIRADSQVSIFVAGQVSAVPSFCTSFDIGAGTIVRCKGVVAGEVIRNLNGVVGVNFRFKGGISDVQKLLSDLNASVVSHEKLGGISCVLAFSPKLKTPVRVGDKLVNLQIALSGENITFGSPIILDSY